MTTVRLVFALSLLLAACGSTSSTDDDGPPDDAATDLPTVIQPTSGSGTMASPEYEATVRVGGPPPHQESTSAKHTVEPVE